MSVDAIASSIPPGLKVVKFMTTGSVDAVDALKAREAGANDDCVKTADCLPLSEALKDIIK